MTAFGHTSFDLKTGFLDYFLKIIYKWKNNVVFIHNWHTILPKTT